MFARDTVKVSLLTCSSSIVPTEDHRGSVNGFAN
jgi:hypothetical protein